MIYFLRWPRLPLFACFLSMATMRSWPLFQLDIKNVFLHGDLENEVYMEQLPGFVAQRESGLVCKLCCSLYGLKRFTQAWFSWFSLVVLVWYDSKHNRPFCFLSSYLYWTMHLLDCLCG